MLNQVSQFLTVQGNTKTMTSTFHLDLTDPGFAGHNIKVDINGNAQAAVVVEGFASIPAAHAEAVLKLNGTIIYDLIAGLDPPYGTLGPQLATDNITTRIDITSEIGTVVEFIVILSCDSNDANFASGSANYTLTALCDPAAVIMLQFSPNPISLLVGGGVVYSTLTARTLESALVGETLNLTYDTPPTGLSFGLSSSSITIGDIVGTGGTSVLVTATIDSTVPVGSYFITFHGDNTIGSIPYNTVAILNIIVNPTGGGGSGGS